MPLYNSPQSGYNAASPGKNLTALQPGQQMVLFDGTEAFGVGVKSVAFARGSSPSLDDAGITFSCTGMASDTEVDVQVAANDTDAEYTTVTTISASTSPDTGNGAYTDVGRSAFYRLYVSGYTTGSIKAKATR